MMDFMHKILLAIAIYLSLSLAGYCQPGYATPQYSHSQTINITFDYGLYGVHSYVPVFLDKTNLYTSPTQSSAVEEQLSAGQIVEIVSEHKQTELGGINLVGNLRSENTNELSLTVNGYSDYWYAVKALDSGKIGFIWGGALAKAAVQLNKNGSRIIVFGLSGKGKNADGEKLGEVKLVENGKTISKAFFSPIETRMREESQNLFNYTVSTKVLSSKGFCNNPQIICIHFMYEACDYEGGDVLFFVINNKLNYLLTASGSFNEEGGGIESRYVLPTNKGGISNRIIVIETVHGFHSGKEQTAQIISRSRTIYLWNGDTFLKTSSAHQHKGARH